MRNKCFENHSTPNDEQQPKGDPVVEALNIHMKERTAKPSDNGHKRLKSAKEDSYDARPQNIGFF